MASHIRTISESSFEYVKTDDESQELLKQEVKKDNQDVLSFNSEISSEEEAMVEESSEDGSEEEDNASEVLSIQDVVDKDKTIQNEETYNSDKSETVSLKTHAENFVGDSSGLTVEIPNDEDVMNVENKLLESTDNKDQLEDHAKCLDELDKLLQEASQSDAATDKTKEHVLFTEVPKLEEMTVESLTATVVSKSYLDEQHSVQTDPLGAMETPILQQSVPKGQEPEKKEDKKCVKPSKESIIFAEITQLRYEVDNITRIQKADKEKIHKLQKQVERLQEAERMRDERDNPPVQVAVCGEWRLTNMKATDDTMRYNGVPFQDRWRSVTAHLVYDFDGNRLLSHSKLCCKTFNRVDLRLGLDISPGGGLHAKTYIKGKSLITIWAGQNGASEKHERFIRNGKLHVVIFNQFGEKSTKIYEKVERKTDIVYSLCSAANLYLKFW